MSSALTTRVSPSPRITAEARRTRPSPACRAVCSWRLSAPSVDREAPMSDEISIQFTRFSAFYTPLIATIAGGFL